MPTSLLPYADFTRPQRQDPASRVRDRLQQLESRIQDPFGQSQARRAARKSEAPYKLGDEERSGLLKSIAGGTAGTLAAFGNIMDLPGSSVRDILSTVTGKPQNPFDQWLPWNWTTREGRIEGRDLGRQWGWMKDKDTWGNLAGGIAIDVATDPLLLLGFGAGGAATKLGRVADATGMMKYAQGALNKINKARAVAGQPVMGMREFKRVGTIDDLLGAIPPALQKTAMDEFADAAKRFGFASVDDMLQETGRQGFQSVARYGLPRMKMFGANLRDRLKDSPGWMIGDPTSPWAQKYARFWDKAFSGLGKATKLGYASRMIKSKMMPSVQQMTQEHTQAAAKAYTAAQEAGGQTARRAATTAETVLYDLADNPRMAAWLPKNYYDTPEKFAAFQREYRGLAENIAGAKQRVAAGMGPDAAKKLDDLFKSQFQDIEDIFNFAKEAGVRVSKVDDLFLTQYYPRQWSAFLQSPDLAKHLDMPRGGVGMESFSQHLLPRTNLFRDAVGGARGIDRVVTDEYLRGLVKEFRQAQGDKALEKLVMQRATPYIQKTYGPNAADAVFTWTRPSAVNPHAAKLKRKPPIPGAAMRGRLLNSAKGKAADVARKDFEQARQAREAINLWAENWEKSGKDPKWINEWIVDTLADMDITPGAQFAGTRIPKKQRLWAVEDTRYRDMFRFMTKAPDAVLERGIYGNWPFFDLENYKVSMMDAILKGNTTTDILGHPASYLPKGARGGIPLKRMLDELNLATGPMRDVPVGGVTGQVVPSTVMRKIAASLNDIPLDQVTKKHVAEVARRRVTPETFDDLKQYFNLLREDEATGWFKRVTDSFMVTFKGNVTSPFPAFHARNLMSGQFRNVVAGQFSLRAFGDSMRMLWGKDLPDLVERMPGIKQEYARIKQLVPDLGPLDNAMANRILQMRIREYGTAGRYSVAARGAAAHGPHQATHPSAQQLQKQLQAKDPLRGSATYAQEGAPGSVPFSLGHAARQYVGMFHKHTQRYYDQQLGRMVENVVDVPAQTTLLPFIHRQPGSYRGMGITGSKELLGSQGPYKFFGPSMGGLEFGHAIEHSNRVTPLLKLLYDGHGFASAHAKATAAQISYRAKDFSKFEREVLKRIIPFYSFSSRTIPWALRRFVEHPGNLLSQTIRGTKRTAEHMQAQVQHPGPVPPHIGDSLAIPLEPDVPGVKRFLTGFDVMSQDLWELGIPLVRALTGHGLRANLGNFISQLGARTHPLYGKLPVELMTGTSLWQRGVEGGRPLVSMDPPLARLMQSAKEMAAKISGKEIAPEDWVRLGTPTMLDQLVSASPATRYLSTARQIMDVRKGLGAKAVNLLTGARITDVSPRAQEAVLREHLRSMIRESGGIVFERATFTKDQLAHLKATNPVAYQKALQLQALSNERVHIAKKMKELARKGLPIHQAFD